MSNIPLRDVRYFLAGTGHVFNKQHALESFDRLRGMGKSWSEELAMNLRQSMDKPVEFSSPSSRLTTCAAILLLYEWEYAGLFDIIEELSRNKHEVGQELILSDLLDMYPQMMPRCKSLEERVALCKRESTDPELRLICLESLIISALHYPIHAPQITELCFSFWQKKTPKAPDLWARALFGSIQLGDKKRTDLMLKAAKNNQLSNSERKSYVEAIKALMEGPLNELVEESKNLTRLQIDFDIAEAFANFDIFDTIQTFGGVSHGLKMPRHPDDQIPVRFFVFDVKMMRNNFAAEIRIADTQSFYQLHEAILASLEWDDDHLFAFYLDNKFQGSLAVIDGDPETDGYFADEVLLSEAKMHEGQMIGYLFDFGDNHEFTLNISQIETYDPNSKAHAFDCEVVKRATPPEQYTEF
jgi:hypothetical protein